jgi:hypothetical protein
MISLKGDVPKSGKADVLAAFPDEGVLAALTHNLPGIVDVVGVVGGGGESAGWCKSECVKFGRS